MKIGFSKICINPPYGSPIVGYFEPRFTKGCLHCEAKNIIVTAVKQAEDSSENIIRLYEAEGAEACTEICLFEKPISIKLSHNAVKTYSENGKEMNMIEW